MHDDTHATASIPGDSSQARQDAAVVRSGIDDGRIGDAFRAALEEGAALYAHMVALRLVSARMIELQRTEKIAFHTSSIGDEAAIVGAVLAARAQDWIFPDTREWGAALVRGLPIASYVHQAFGSSRDRGKGHCPPDHPPAKAQRVALASGITGAHVLQAVGAAWAAKISKDDVASLALFGEAAKASGDFHNAVNFAGVFKAPCVFVCREDGRAPRARPAPPQGERESAAVAYGIASARVDGTDAFAVLTVVRAAMARAASGKGPTLVDAITRPLGPPPESLTEDAWNDGARAVLDLGDTDPLVRLRRALEKHSLLEPAAHDALVRETRGAIDAAVIEARDAAAPAPETLFEDVFRSVPSHLRAQKESSTWRR